jgi:hypothetical protein
MKPAVFFKRAFLIIIMFFLCDLLISLVLINGLNKYYGFDQKPEILINGSSMAMSGFNRTDIQSITSSHVATYAQEGVSVSDRYEMINHFFHMFPQGVKTVIYEVNPVIFSNAKSAENVYTHFFPYMDDKSIDNYVKENAGTREYFANKIIRTKRFESRVIRLIVQGYLGNYDNIKTNTFDTATLTSFEEQRGEAEVVLEKSNIEIFEETMGLIRSHNSNIILIMMPMYYLKFQTFNNDGYRVLSNYFEDFSSSHEGINFIDLNRDSLIYSSEYFSDPLHFNVYGQRQITGIVGPHIIDDLLKAN